MNQEFISALDQLETEKNIDKEELIQAIEASIASAYRKNYREAKGVEVTIDRETGEITVYETKKVVENVEDPKTEIKLEDALDINPFLELDDFVKIATTPKDFGRIAAQNAKQLIMQKIMEAERNKIYEEYSTRIDENLNGEVSRINNGNIYINFGSTDSVLLPTDQIPNEKYKPGQRIKVYLANVRNTPKGVQLKVSRTHPNFIKRLFEEEIPEFYDGKLDIKNVAREAGVRSKVAVISNDENLDIIGTCIGPKGSRIQNILNEIGNERIDVVEYSKDIEEYIKSALSPAQIEKIYINPDKKNSLVIVDNSQLALAIGKEGRNVQLAAKLTGWKIDIKSKSQFDELLLENPEYIKTFTEPSPKRKVDKELEDLVEDGLFFDFNFDNLEENDDDLFKDEEIKDILD